MSTTRVEGVVAMTEGTKECGAIVWWSLSGSVDYAKFSEAWADSGLDANWFITPVTPKMALHRAVSDLEQKRRLVRSLEVRGHYAVVDEAVDGEEIDHTVTCRVHIEDDLPKVIPYVAKIKDAVDYAFDKHLDALAHEDIGWWLKTMAHNVNAVTLRDRGGVYFIPAAQMPQWKRIVEVLGSVSDHTVFKVPAMTSEGAVEAILSAVTREAEQAAQDFEDALIDDSLGHRALTNRERRCKALRAKVKSYESILGASLETFQERLLILEGQLAAAALASMEQGDEEQAA